MHCLIAWHLNPLTTICLLHRHRNTPESIHAIIMCASWACFACNSSREDDKGVYVKTLPEIEIAYLDFLIFFYFLIKDNNLNFAVYSFNYSINQKKLFWLILLDALIIWFYTNCKNFLFQFRWRFNFWRKKFIREKQIFTIEFHLHYYCIVDMKRVFVQRVFKERWKSFFCLT